MDQQTRPNTTLFDVFLRLRPSYAGERFLAVEESAEGDPRHITIRPPSNDHRKRAVERFAFTRVFEENASQLDLFSGTGVIHLIQGVLAPQGQVARDGLLATLGVTGSGKTHTILGSKSQRGLTQMSLDVIFASIGQNIVPATGTPSVYPSLAAADVSEAQIVPGFVFLESLYGDGQSLRGSCSMLQTPLAESSYLSLPSSKQRIPRPSAMPKCPQTDEIVLPIDQTAEYAILVSMYEVYNDRIFDLLAGSSATAKAGALKRRALLFKSTEHSDRKVVAGLRKIVCCTLEEALMVLETGLAERKVAGTGSNAVSSRSHGFFCVEVKKRNRVARGAWSTSVLSIVDLAGSERARQAKTAGATLAEAGKINESLMYLGQCMQMQSDNQDGTKQSIVPFRQCKLTELLFSNSFPSSLNSHNSTRNPQKAIMIVTADATGDFNATSQILRYSALAREITVPRIPSTASTILAGQPTNPRQTSTPPIEELEAALKEVARLTEHVDVLVLQLAEERSRREAAEACWRASEERMLQVEQEIRDECYEEMEASIESERRRWKGAWDEEADRNDEHLDKKLEILARGIQIAEDPKPEGEERIWLLEEENARLRLKIETMEREKQLQSPTKKQRVLKARKWDVVEVESP